MSYLPSEYLTPNIRNDKVNHPKEVVHHAKSGQEIR